MYRITSALQEQKGSGTDWVNGFGTLGPDAAFEPQVLVCWIRPSLQLPSSHFCAGTRHLSLLLAASDDA
jgi:hypothetical protein